MPRKTMLSRSPTRPWRTLSPSMNTGISSILIMKPVVEPFPGLVYKDSWPLVRDVNIKVDLYAAVYGQFGVPRLRASQRLDDNSRWLKGVTAWDPFGGNDPPPEPELRAHVRLYYSTFGHPFSNCKMLHELLECILHARIGRYNVLAKAKALHPDVSEGNISLVDEAVTGVEMFYGLSNFGYVPDGCRWFLLDGDPGKPIGDRAPPTPRKPFP
ncbi:hypothetical protein BS47DRAFT_748180 [Hydnum rufescens UP504]|uniref:Fungal-type protein kinase domain-containing protein n=1 Tax=Hydnum rufescens UP504 TaxID=1448309 RepID=A0A9P6BAH2_9AGAM|nr:hypothetical protein BS47DRAFT_748180 [Hydnum rufescens UP504]